MSDSPYNQIEGVTGTETLVNQGTIEGAGNIGAGRPLTLENAGTINATGTNALVIQPGTGGFTDSGTLQAVHGSTLQVVGGYTQSAGSTIADGTVTASGGSVTINGGTLSGSGTVNGNVILAGTVNPGDYPVSFGQLTINGDFTQTSTGIFNEEIGGTSSGTDYTVLDINGSASLGGTLNIMLTNNFFPSLGDVFQIMDYGSETGMFSVNGNEIGDGEQLVIAYGPSYITLTTETMNDPPPPGSTPEPASLALLLSGLIAVAFCCRLRITAVRR
jgi:hypothetical protein